MGGWVEVWGHLRAETEEAILLEVDDEELEWIPKSQIESWDDWSWEIGVFVEINIRRWIAEKKGLC